MFGVCVVNFENHCCVEGGDVSLKFGQWKERTIGIGGICRYVLLHYIMLKGMRKVTTIFPVITKIELKRFPDFISNKACFFFVSTIIKTMRYFLEENWYITVRLSVSTI